MTADIINGLVTIALVELMFVMGLTVKLGELMQVLRNVGLIIRSLLVNYACVPAITVALLYLFDAAAEVALGFLILSVCPGAPYAPPLTAVANGNVAVAVGLMLVLAGSSAVLAPVQLPLLIGAMSHGGELQIDALRIARTLFLTQLLPMGVGITMRHWRPQVAQRMLSPATGLSKILNLAAIGMILVVQFPSLLEIRPLGFLGMLCLLGAIWAAAWLLGGNDKGIRLAMTISAPLRNVAVGLVIATSLFPGTAAVTAVAAYGVISLFGSLAFALAVRGRPESMLHEKLQESI